MKLIIDVEKDYYEIIKHSVEHGQDYKPFEIIANGIPYDKVIDEVTELLENEWGYEGMKDDVSRIMKGGTNGQFDYSLNDFRYVFCVFNVYFELYQMKGGADMTSSYLCMCFCFFCGWIMHIVWKWAKDEKGGAT